MTGAAEVEVAGERLHLLPEKAVWWPAGGTVFVADPHWGKADSFRAGGMAVPAGGLTADLARLDRLLAATGAARLVILGDLFHDRASVSAGVCDAVAGWRAGRAELAIHLVRGNHDRRSGDPPADWHFACDAEPVGVGPFAGRHYPDPTPGLYTLAGHLHPGVTLVGAGRQRLRLPCFWFGPAVGVLPAFGSFTGLADVRPARGDRVFVAAEGEVVRV